MPLEPQYLDAIKKLEGWSPRAKWDYKQWSNGYGTRARYPGEIIDQDEGERRFKDEIGKAASRVDSLGTAFSPAWRARLTSLTYNAGDKWVGEGLGQAVKSGNWDDAARRYAQYIKAGGIDDKGLYNRRMAELAWRDPENADAESQPGGFYGSAAPPPPPSIPQSASPQGRTMTTQWTPEDNIRQGRRSGEMFFQTPPGGFGSGWAGGLAAALSGLGYGLHTGSANAATMQNQQMRGDAMRSAADAPDNVSMGRLLMGGGVPDLQEMGFKTLAGERSKAADRDAQLVQEEKLLKIRGEQALKQKQAELELQNRLAREEEERRLRLLGFGQPAPAAAQPAMPVPLPEVSGGPDSGSFRAAQEIAPPAIQPQSVMPDELAPPVRQPTQATGLAGSVSDDKRRRAAIAIAMGDKAGAAKILSEADDKKGSEAYDTELGKGLAKDMDEIRGAARKSAARLGMLNVLKQLSDDPNTPQGPGTQAELALRRTLAAIGIPTDGLSQAQMFTALSNQLSLEMRDPSAGAGMPGAMSDKDREFLVSMSPNLANTPAGNRMLIEYMSRVAKRQVEVARLANNYASRNNGRIDDRFFDLLGQWSEKNPLFPESARMLRPAPPGAADAGQPTSTKDRVDTLDQIPEGSRVIDHVTGQNLIKRGGQLVPFTDPTMVPSAPGSPAQRFQQRRQDANQAQSTTSDQVQAQFDQDALTMVPIDILRKYDGMRGSLTAAQLARLDEMLARATSRRRGSP